jgi:glutamyl-tRNA synthetase
MDQAPGSPGPELARGALAPEGDALAQLLYPEARDAKPPEAYEAAYPLRDLPRGAMVTRYAPSPTGFMHIGGIFVSLINKLLALQTGGVFFLRIEDTDAKRTIPGALETIVDTLERYDLAPQEGLVRGPHGGFEQRGAYGPYVQTERAAIYRDFAISLIRRGLAYPCFLTVEEMSAMREQQLAANIKPGVHGSWARWRDAPLAKVEQQLKAGASFVIRLRAPALPEDPRAQTIEWKDGIRGTISMPANDLDAVLLKSDGIPTYHFAHAVDDHLMRTTHVIRGDEWISSMPLHLALFRTLGFRPVEYAHVPPIQKIDRNEQLDEKTGETRTVDSRRKLSKRKDAEANIEYYHELGVPETATIYYLLNIANSAFEGWWKKNPSAPYTTFPLKLNKFAAGGALSDVVKLKSISKDIVARMSADEIYPMGLAWARKHDPELAELMQRYPDYTRRALSIERNTPKGNKRVVTWEDLRPQLGYFYDELFERAPPPDFPAEPQAEERTQLLRQLASIYDASDVKEVWLEKLRGVALAAGFAADAKQLEASPGAFKGHAGDVVMLVRLAVCGTRQSPDLYEVLQILGAERVRARLSR